MPGWLVRYDVNEEKAEMIRAKMFFHGARRVSMSNRIDFVQVSGFFAPIREEWADDAVKNIENYLNL